jgi:predicted dehydrogenase
MRWCDTNLFDPSAAPGPVESERLVVSSPKQADGMSLAASQQLRVGVVGCGYWGSKHLRVLNRLGLTSFVAIDSDGAALNAVAGSLPAAKCFERLDDALAQIDAAIIATPPRSHTEIALRCLERGKHVLVEKPMAMSQLEAHSLINAARRSNATLMVGHTFEYDPAIAELKRRMMLGELGHISHIHSARLNLGRHQRDINVVWDLVAHDVSIMNYLLNGIPSHVAAWASTNPALGMQDIAYVKLEYRAEETTGYVHASWLDPKKVREVTVVGDKKMAIYCNEAQSSLTIFDRGVDLIEDPQGSTRQLLSYRSGSTLSPEIPCEEPLLMEVHHFIDCISRNTIPRSSGENGLAVVAVLEAIDKALATGSTVKVNCQPHLIDIGSRVKPSSPRASIGS